jgi:lipoprotein-anchoring transpeptidase ErfK/SrfK
MFRGYMPALTLFVFGIGIGIGHCWSRGLIPFSVTPANSGSISPEFSNREPLPPPPDDVPDLEAPDNPTKSLELSFEDADLLQDQTEPEVNDAKSASLTISREQQSAAKASNARPAVSSTDDFDDSAESENARPVVRLRKRSQKTSQSTAQAEFDDEPPVEKRKKVVAVAHQDPGESANDAREASAGAGSLTPSPQDLLAVAEEKLANGDTLKAHRDLSTIYWNHKEFRPQIQEMIDSTANAIFFQSKPHYVDPYVIQEGERLEAIAKKYRLSWEYLAKLNRTNPKRIQVGQKLKVIKGPFGAVVDLKDFTLTIHLQGYYVKQYEVGIGKDGSTPIGKFPVMNKVEDPEYTDLRTGKRISGSDPTNPLGERWIDLGDSYGIHGTIEPDSIGKAASRGCIRLRDKDIIEVYDFLVKGSEVVIR